MARFETWLTADLKKDRGTQSLHGQLFSADAGANVIGVEVLDDGAAATLSGTVAAYIVRGDGATITAEGTLSGNRASVVLPAAAYSVEGPIRITIKLTSGSAVTTLISVVGEVCRATTDTILDSGTVITLVSTVNLVHPDTNGNVNLTAADITDGTFDAARTPSLNASKIGGGTLAVARLPVMQGAEANAAGEKGVVPAPAAGDQGKVLKGNAAWGTLSAADVNAIPITGGEASGGITAPHLYAKAASSASLPRLWILDNAGSSMISLLPVEAGSGRARIREITSPGTDSNYEDYRLPAPTQTSGAGTYDILTSKAPVTVAQGGTGASSVEAAQVALLGSNVYINAANGPNVSDLNDLTVAGLWITPGDTPHAPTSDPYNVLVTNGTNRGTQLAWRSTGSTKVVYMRKWSTNGWGDWEIIAAPNPAALSDVYYAAGDSYQNSGNYVMPITGYVATNGKALYFSIPTDKSLAKVSTVTISRLQGAIRCAGGCIAGKTSSTYDWTTHTGVSLTAVKAANNVIRLYMNFETAPENAVADTPAVGAFLVTFSFS